MTTDRRQERAGLPRAGPTDAKGTRRGEVRLRWSEPTHSQHAGRALDAPRPVLLDRAWPYEPTSCVTGVRVVALRVADGSFVCHLCGLRTS